MECLVIIVVGHFPKMCREASSSSPHAEQIGSVPIFITARCLLSEIWPVRRLVSTRRCGPVHSMPASYLGL